MFVLWWFRYGNEHILRLGGLINENGVHMSPLEIESVNIRNLEVQLFGLELTTARFLHSCDYTTVGNEEMVVVAGKH